MAQGNMRKQDTIVFEAWPLPLNIIENKMVSPQGVVLELEHIRRIISGGLMLVVSERRRARKLFEPLDLHCHASKGISLHEKSVI